jgi:hypothetical protein
MKIVFSDSFLTFCKQSDSRIARIIRRYLEIYKASDTGCREGSWGWIYNKQFELYERFMFTDEEVNYITFRNDGTISYLPAGKEFKRTENGDWSLDGRQNGKPGKIIRKIFLPKAQKLFKDSDFEHFGNQYKSYYGKDYDFVMHDRSDIGEVYLKPAESGDGTLNNSCMRNVSKEFFRIYEKCESLRLLALYNKAGQVAGRALIWNLEYDDKPITFMDRIYTTKEHLVESFKEYAKKEGFWIKRKQSYDSKHSFITPSGECLNALFEINTDTDCRKYPYIDTFTYGRDGTLTNDDNSQQYAYSNTNGQRDGQYYDDDDDDNDSHEGEFYDDIADEWTDDSYHAIITHGEYSGLSTHEENTVRIGERVYWCESSLIRELNNGDYVLTEDAYYCEYECAYFSYDEVVFSDYDGCYYLSGHCVESVSGWILKTDAVTVDGKIFHADMCDEQGGEDSDPAAIVPIPAGATADYF